MKNKLVIIILLLSTMLYSSYAQIGLFNKIKNATKKEKKEKITEQGITNETHRNYVGKIVFNTERISFQAPDESKFKTEFNATDRIYGRFYAEHSAGYYRKEKYNSGAYMLRGYYSLTIDGEKIDAKFKAFSIQDQVSQRTTQQLYINQNPTERDYEDNSVWFNIINNMSPGTHKVEVDYMLILDQNEEDNEHYKVASGVFNIVKKEGDKLLLGKRMADFTAGMEDAELEAEVVKAINKNARRNGWKEIFHSAKIKSDSWYIIRHKNSGVIMGRSISAYCFAKWPDGHCTVQVFFFKQQYDGSKYMKKLLYYGLKSGSQEKIDCE